MANFASLLLTRLFNTQTIYNLHLFKLPHATNRIPNLSLTPHWHQSYNKDACFACLPPYASICAMNERNAYSRFINAIRKGNLPLNQETIMDDQVGKWVRSILLRLYTSVHWSIVPCNAWLVPHQHCRDDFTTGIQCCLDSFPRGVAACSSKAYCTHGWYGEYRCL